MHRAWAFLRRDALIAVSYRTAFVLQFGSIFVAVPLFYFMGRMMPQTQAALFDRYGGSYFAFLLIGVAFVDYLAISLRCFDRSLRESQLMGTLEIVLLSPTSLAGLLIYSSLWVYLFTTARFLMYLVAGFFLGLDLRHADPLSALLVLALAVPAFASLGILSAAVTLLIKRGDLINVGISSASLVLGGVLFPVEVLPRWLQTVAQFLPVTHALEAMRLALFQGASPITLAPQLGVLALFAAGLGPLSLAAFAWSLRLTKRSGTLAHY